MSLFTLLGIYVAQVVMSFALVAVSVYSNFTAEQVEKLKDSTLSYLFWMCFVPVLNVVLAAACLIVSVPQFIELAVEKVKTYLYWVDAPNTMRAGLRYVYEVANGPTQKPKPKTK